MDLKRRFPALALGGTVLATAMLAGAGGVAAQEGASYRVWVFNLASGQPLTPPVVVLHNDKTSIVEPGQPASAELQQLAENGNNEPLVEALNADKNVFGVATGTAPILSGGAPGAAEFPSYAVIDVDSSGKADRISVASMLICSNDGFSKLSAKKLPKKVGQQVVYVTDAYDAGTEINTEVLADMVPPCQGLVGVSSDAEGTGETDPSLAENGVVTPHPGIAGAADLDPEIHAVASAPAVIIVQRTA